MPPQDLQATDPVEANQQSDLPVTSNLCDGNKSQMEPEEEEDEDEDIDFNPFLRGSPSAEASSSLSSEVEGLDLDVVDSGSEFAQPLADDSALKQIDVSDGLVVDNANQIDEIMTRKIVTLEEHLDQEQEEAATRESKKRKSSGMEKDFPLENEIGPENGAVAINDVTKEGAGVPCRDSAIASDDEDAICRRTRARYSLASFTLDELETFLQETDDDDDLQNVDEEEEYRKFLASVLQGGDKDDETLLDNGNDEDEDNDADFEIEIEEALESDIDDYLAEKGKMKGTRRCPETRQNRRQTTCSVGKKKHLGQELRPLRRLLPILPTTFIPSIPSNIMVETAPNLLSSGNNCSLNGFTPHQIGQLYSLMHEHVQLLIQVFSLCVLEPLRLNISTQVQGLLSEMLNKCDQVLARRDVPHPSFCFHSPYIHPSIVDEHPKYLPRERTVRLYEMNDEQIDISSSTYNSQVSPDVQSCNANGRATKETMETFQTVQSSSWLPFVDGPILSILDVPPLKLVGKYMDDVSTVVHEQVRRYVEATGGSNSEKQPLFPLPVCLSFSEPNAVTAKGGVPASPEFSTVRSSPNHRPAKKTLAATLVESSKKQSVALVPKRIAELARQFYPLFNPALFPHKPPPLAVANRVLFTDAEDGLLAMGLMEYNTDWKAIQQRFLPCKSKHQIFVRQKNRCSSKAPDNSIKEVRKLKTSPLTEEEKARISEGLTVYKLDWMSIWKFIVPYRDPSLLPRQWRIALGMQRSYKVDATKRERRRLYESNRRRNKAVVTENLQASYKEDDHAGVRNESGEECTENNDEAYVHEAFLADWRPAPSIPISEISTSILNSRCLPTSISAEERSSIRKVPNNPGNHDYQANRVHYSQEFTAALEYSTKAGYVIRRPFSTDPNCSTFNSAMKPSTFVCYSRPYRARKRKGTQLVRLAPSLPPVNLPPSVRVIPQAAFQKSQHGTPNQAASACAGTGAGRESTFSRPNHAVNSDSGLNNVKRNRTNITPSCSQEAECLNDQSADQENSIDSDLQMHPLLFQAPGNEHLPYYPLSSGTTAPNSFSFFPMAPHQVNLPTFQNSRQPGALVDTSKRTPSCSLDFHPLLQRICNVDTGSKAACQRTRFSTDSQPSRAAIPSFGAANELDLNSVPQKEKDTAADGIEVLSPSNGGNLCVKNRADDQSLPAIVMEQEELSDSDDEVENVEFECEEMTDSEGEDEEPYSHQILNAQNTQQPDTRVNMDDPDNLCKSSTHGTPESLECRSETPSKTGLSGPGDDVVRSPWLSLNSQVLDHSHPRQSKIPVSNSDANVASNHGSPVISQSSRPQKNLNPRRAKNATTSKSDADVQQLQADAVAVISRSPRKRASRVSLSSNMDVGNSSCRKNNGG